MKTFGKIIICIIVILLAIGTACLIHNNKTTETNSNNISNTNTNTISNNQNIDNEKIEIEERNENDENTEYIGEEEQQEENIENEETENEENQDNKDKQEELTGKDKAIDIVTKKYAMEGETVKFDHMEGSSYVIKINAGTAVTWYLVDGTSWEASEY